MTTTLASAIGDGESRQHLVERRVGHWTSIHAAANPSRLAVIAGDRRVTWAEFDARVISGGVNVYASDLEDAFAKHPDVTEVAAIAIPHEKWGETPLVLVVPRPQATSSAEQIRDFGNERLGKHQRSARVEFRTSLPRNALGKVMKAELREPYWPAT
jgi:acyl-CoA synthetase (AMP-forming)/AMP-acid ligase II